MDISFIIPVYNTPVEILQKCIASIERVCIDKEIIVIDDGSREELSTAYEQIPNICYYRQNNAGVSVARNTGIQKARGAYIAFVDSDDCIEAAAYSKDMLKDRYDLYVFDMEITENHIQRNINALPTQPGLVKMEDMIRQFTLTPYMNGPYAKLYKSEKVRELRFRTGMVTGEDLDFTLNYLERIKTIYYVRQNAYYYDKNHATYAKRYVQHTDKILEYYFVNSDHLKKLIGCYHLEHSLYDYLDRKNLEGLFQIACELSYHGRLDRAQMERICMIYQRNFADMKMPGLKIKVIKVLFMLRIRTMFKGFAYLRNQYLRRGVHF